jgi:predicted nuclease of predicted toxin-antitoxin system
MRLLIDESMPRRLAAELRAKGMDAQDVRDVGLRGHPDDQVLEMAASMDAIIVTRDRGFTYEKAWPEGFTAGVVFVNLPDSTPSPAVNARATDVLSGRADHTLLGAITVVERSRALSRRVRRRP